MANNSRRPPHLTLSRLTPKESEEMNNYEAIPINLTSPNWNIPVGNKNVKGNKSIFYLTNVNRLRNKKTKAKTRKNKK